MQYKIVICYLFAYLMAFTLVLKTTCLALSK